MKTNLLIMTIVLSFLLSACAKKTEFFYLKDEQSLTTQTLYEHIVIANPSKDFNQLYADVVNYSESHFDMCHKIAQGFSLNYFFYRETRDTPRDFKSTGDSCSWGAEHIGCQTDDIIVVIENRRKANGQDELEFKIRESVDDDWQYFDYDPKCEK